MLEGVGLFAICIGILLLYVTWLKQWSKDEASYEQGWVDGYNACTTELNSPVTDEDAQKVNKYIQNAIISYIENNDDYRRGDKKRIRECTTSAQLENEVYGILERE